MAQLRTWFFNLSGRTKTKAGEKPENILWLNGKQTTNIRN